MECPKTSTNTKHLFVYFCCRKFQVYIYDNFPFEFNYFIMNFFLNLTENVTTVNSF